MSQSATSSIKSGWIALLVLSSLALSIWALQVRIDRGQTTEVKPESFLLYLPSGNLLGPLTLGYREFAADLLWIKTVDYFGGHYATDRSYTWLYHMLDLVTTLDPHFVFPFQFGAVILSVEAREQDNSIKLLKKAMELNPSVWQFPFFMGFNLYFYKKDYQQASRFIDAASRLPGAPAYLKQFAVRLYVSAGDRSNGLTLLREVYRNTKDEKMRAEILNRIQELAGGQSDARD